MLYYVCILSFENSPGKPYFKSSCDEVMLGSSGENNATPWGWCGQWKLPQIYLLPASIYPKSHLP